MLLVLALVGHSACAIDISPGDYGIPTPGTELAFYYGRFVTSRALKREAVADAVDARVDVNVNLLRLVHYGEVRGLPYAVQTIIPFGVFTTAEIDGTTPSRAEGLGDVVIAASIFPVGTPDTQRGPTVGLTAFLALPTENTR